MAKLTSFSDFVNGDKPIYNNQPKPYIYVIKYILSKEDYADELKEYILTYQDDETDYEDENSYDPFMNKLKSCAMNDEIEEIEDMIMSYDEFEDDNFDEDDDDYEEKMYTKKYMSQNDEEEFEDESPEDIEEEIENSTMSDKLKDFLKIDLNFEDLDEYATYSKIPAWEDKDDTLEEVAEDVDFVEINEENEFEEAEDIDYEEIIEEDLEDLDEEEILSKKDLEKMRDKVKAIRFPKKDEDEIIEEDLEDGIEESEDEEE